MADATPEGRRPPRRSGMRRENSTRHSAGPVHTKRRTHPTTSFLTATTLTHVPGAGVTAAAGTRLALQWLLDKRFTLFSFQSQVECFDLR